MCQSFRPEDPPFNAVGDGVTDDSQAFADCIEAMSAGDTLLLSCRTYRLDRSLVITKNLSILGEHVSPHFARHRSVLLFPPNVLGIQVLHGLTIRDVGIQALISIRDPRNPAQTITRDWRTNAHGIWTRRTLLASNVDVEGFATDGVFLDSRTRNFIPASVTINNNASPGPQTATVTLSAGTPNDAGNEAVGPYFVVALYGFQTVTPSNGAYVRWATVNSIEVDLAGTPGANPLASFSGLSAARDASNGIGTITGLPRGHGLIAGCRITTAGFSETVANAPVLSEFTEVVNAVTFHGITYDHASGAASGSLGTSGSLAVTQGLLRSIENSSHWELHTCRLINNGRHGLHTDGPDSNAGLAVKVDARSNGAETGNGSGFYEESFLGNTYLACHTNANRRSYDKPADSASNRSRFLSCYAERNQAAPLITYPAYSLNGQGSWTGDGQAFGFDCGYGRPTTFLDRSDPANHRSFDVLGEPNTFFRFRARGHSEYHYRFQYIPALPAVRHSSWFRMSYRNLDTVTPFLFSGVGASDTLGDLGNGQFWMPNGFYFGSTDPFTKQTAARRGDARNGCFGIEYQVPTGASARAARFIGWRSSPPTTGSYAPGDLIWNPDGDATAATGWIYTTSGTWRELPRANATVEISLGGVERSLCEALRVRFAAEERGVPGDVILYEENCPGAMRVIDTQVIVSTPVPGSTATLRDATGGGGAALSGSFDTGTAGRHLDTGAGFTATPVVPDRGTLVLRRDGGVAGEVTIWVQRR